MTNEAIKDKLKNIPYTLNIDTKTHWYPTIVCPLVVCNQFHSSWNEQNFPFALECRPYKRTAIFSHEKLKPKLTKIQKEIYRLAFFGLKLEYWEMEDFPQNYQFQLPFYLNDTLKRRISTMSICNWFRWDSNEYFCTSHLNIAKHFDEIMATATKC